MILALIEGSESGQFTSASPLYILQSARDTVIHELIHNS